MAGPKQNRRSVRVTVDQDEFVLAIVGECGTECAHCHIDRSCVKAILITPGGGRVRGFLCGECVLYVYEDLQRERCQTLADAEIIFNGLYTNWVK